MKKLFPDEKIIVTENFNVEQDWYIPIAGFFVISSRKKNHHIANFTDQEMTEFSFLLRNTRRGMKEILGIEYVYLFQNEHTKHNRFHIWIFPRHKWMEKFEEDFKSVKPVISYAQENMTDEKTIKKVKDYVEKMRKYMEKNWPVK